MDRSIAIEIAMAAKQLGYQIRVREHYFGRAMSGGQTVGLEYSSTNELLASVAKAAFNVTQMEEQALAKDLQQQMLTDLQSLRYDSAGRNSIAY